MASKTTSPHHQLFISIPNAKTHSRSRNSRKFSKCKQRKRSSEQPSSDSEDADHHQNKPTHKKHGSIKQQLVSGHSSSEETSERNSNRLSTADSEDHTNNDDDDLSDDANQEQMESCSLRKRIIVNNANPPLKFVACEENPNEWEIIDPAVKINDSPTVTGDSSDDFWKYDAKIPLLEKCSARKIRSPHAESRISLLLQMFRNSRHEWTQFNSRHQIDLKILRKERNKCVLGLLIIFIFCGIGGIIFHSTEGAFEMYYKCGVKRVKRDFLDTLWTKRYLREDEWKSLARSKLMEFENQLYDAYDAGMSSYSGQKGWSFINSFFYCITVVTTIGYGHITPVTTAGQVITIVYSIIGIPLFLILLADYGKLFTRGIKYVWAFIRRLYYTGSCRTVRKTAPVQEVVKGVQMVFDMTNRRKSSNPKENSDPHYATSPIGTPALSTYTIDDEFNLPISVALAVLVMYLIGGAFMFSFLEGWTLFQSFYFVYISTSTIGLGDFVPKGQVYVLLCSIIYFVFGLALTSMCINVVTEKMTDSFRQATAKIGATMGLQMTSENGLQLPEVVPQDIDQAKIESEGPT